jgi:tRNA-dihydrouridine synthase A
MMERTDRHFRYLVRLITRRVHLYTEMVPARVLVHGDRDRRLRFHPDEHPVALQLGGDDPALLRRCARWARDRGYDEVNLNVGCPSERVQAGRFGACLMLEPARVAECVAAMTRAVAVPITVKTRLGVDDHDSYGVLREFVARVADAGCRTFIVHARKAWLKGLSPRENREVPPLHHDRVARLKEDFPALEIILNGGIATLRQGADVMHSVDGVMIGRAVYDDPYMLAGADRLFYGETHPVRSRDGVLSAMLPYIETELAGGARLNSITRHLLNLYHAMPGARTWRRFLSENAHRPGAGIEVLQRAQHRMEAHSPGRAA